MGNAKLHRILRFRMGSHHLPVEEGRHFNLPRASRVCNLCNTDALGDERHMLLECPALADLRLQFSSLLLPCHSLAARKASLAGQGHRTWWRRDVLCWADASGMHRQQPVAACA